MNIKPLLKSVKKVLTEHAPEILTGLGLVGMGSAVVMAVKATPKAQELVYDECEYEEVDKLSAKQTIKLVWKCYLPAGLTMLAAGSCIIFANKVSMNRQAALAAAYAMSEAAAKKYKDKVIEVLGENKEKREVHDAIHQDELDNHPVSKAGPIIAARGGETLCMDAWTGQYFRSDKDTIQRAINELNILIRNENEACLNDLYDILDAKGLKNCKTGRSFGWNVDMGMVDPMFSSCLADDGTPCLVLDYYTKPRADYMY